MITTKENKMNTNEMNKKAKFIHRNEKHKKIIIQSKYLWKPEGPEENHMTKYYITKLVDLVLDAN